MGKITEGSDHVLTHYYLEENHTKLKSGLEWKLGLSEHEAGMVISAMQSLEY
jgi:hypothetical protein